MSAPSVESLLSYPQAKAGDSLPEVLLKTNGDVRTPTVNVAATKGKFIIVGVPGAFTPPCSSQVPGYISNYDKFVEKGITNIYVVAVNDAFVMNAWQQKLAPEGTAVQFVCDDQAHFVSKLGLAMDVTPMLGGCRSKRFVIVAQDGKVLSVKVEDSAPSVTVTAADQILLELE